MKQIYCAFSLLLLLSVSLSGMGTSQKPDFDTGEIHSLRIDVPCTVTLKRGNDFQLEIEDNKDRISELDIYNDNGTLVFKQKEKNVLRRFTREDLGITLTLPEWKNIRLSSSGEIYSRDPWDNDEISLQTSASGDIRFSNISASHAELKTSASGNIVLEKMNLKGALNLTASGSGNIKIDSVSSASVKIMNSASGTVNLGDVEVSEGQFQLRSTGSGENSFQSVRARNVQLVGQSSSDINGTFDSDSLEVKLSGSGDALLEGRTGIASLQTDGSASIEAYGMIIAEASVSGSGSGDVILKKGTAIREVRFTGSGKLVTR